MTKVQLVTALRARLAEKCRRGELDEMLPESRDSFLRNLHETSDVTMIGGYIICSECNHVSISIDQAVRLAEYCKNLDEWLRHVTAWEEMFGECGHELN